MLVAVFLYFYSNIKADQAVRNEIENEELERSLNQRLERINELEQELEILTTRLEHLDSLAN